MKGMGSELMKLYRVKVRIWDSGMGVDGLGKFAQNDQIAQKFRTVPLFDRDGLSWWIGTENMVLHKKKSKDDLKIKKINKKK